MYEALKEAQVAKNDQNILRLWDAQPAKSSAKAPLQSAQHADPAASQPRGSRKRATSTLINRNIVVDGRRTSARLEPMMWDALEEICARENVSLNRLCDAIDERRQASSLTAAIRIYVMSYFRAAATEDGHAGIGHGVLYGSHRGTTYRSLRTDMQ